MPRWQSLAEMAAIGLVFLVVAGDPAPAVNEQHYLTRLKHYWDPAWCAGDLFLESPDAHFLIVLLAGAATKMAPLAVVAWGGRLIAWGMIAYAWRRLSWSLTPRPWCAVLSAAIWLAGIQWGHFAGEWVVGGVESKCFAYAFVLLGLNAFVQSRWPAVWVHLGVATALHALVGGWSVLLLLALWLRIDRGKKPAFGAMLPWLALGGVIGLAGVAPPIVMNWSTPAEVVAEANRVYVFDRLPHHLAPLSQPDSWIALRAGRHTAMLAMLALATLATVLQRSRQGADQPTLERLARLQAYAVGAAVLLAIGLSIEIGLVSQPERAASLLRYYLFRLSDIATPLAVALTATHAIATGLARQRTASLVGLVGAMLSIAWVFWPNVQARITEPRAPADARVRDYGDWVAACDWVRDNTPTDALFLTPRYANSFKWRAERAEVTNWKDVPQDAASMVEWRLRVHDVYRFPVGSRPGAKADKHGRGPRGRSLGQLGSARLRELGEKYGATHVLTDRRYPASLPVVYRNKTYIVYELR